MKTSYTAQISIAKRYVKDITGKILDTYNGAMSFNGTMYFK